MFFISVYFYCSFADYLFHCFFKLVERPYHSVTKDTEDLLVLFVFGDTVLFIGLLYVFLTGFLMFLVNLCSYISWKCWGIWPGLLSFICLFLPKERKNNPEWCVICWVDLRYEHMSGDIFRRCDVGPFIQHRSSCLDLTRRKGLQFSFEIRPSDVCMGQDSHRKVDHK